MSPFWMIALMTNVKNYHYFSYSFLDKGFAFSQEESLDELAKKEYRM
jgi:hypothetical protein